MTTNRASAITYTACNRGKAVHVESRGGPSDLLTQAGGSLRIIEVSR